MITAEHVERMEAIAKSLSGTRLGPLLDLDELLSQSYVTLWQLACEYDASSGVPFIKFIGLRGKNRLIDWLRTEFGRMSDGQLSEKAQARLTLSLEEHVSEELEGEDAGWLTDQRPGPEDLAVAHDEWLGFARAFKELSPDAQRALVWPIFTASPRGMAAKFDRPLSEVARSRRQAKDEVAEAIGRG